MNDLRGFMFLVLFGLPLIATANLECRIHFICLNATHFHICGDFGDGKLKAIESIIFSCPPRMICDETNKNECHFPVIMTTTQRSTTLVDNKKISTTLSDTVIATEETSAYSNIATTQEIKDDNATNFKVFTNTSEQMSELKAIPQIKSTELNNPIKEIDVNTIKQQRKKNTTYLANSPIDTSTNTTSFTVSSFLFDFTKQYDPVNTTEATRTEIKINSDKNTTQITMFLNRNDPVNEIGISTPADISKFLSDSSTENTIFTATIPLNVINTDDVLTTAKKSTTKESTHKDKSITTGISESVTDKATAINLFTTTYQTHYLKNKDIVNTNNIKENKADQNNKAAIRSSASRSTATTVHLAAYLYNSTKPYNLEHTTDVIKADKNTYISTSNFTTDNIHTVSNLINNNNINVYGFGNVTDIGMTENSISSDTNKRTTYLSSDLNASTSTETNNLNSKQSVYPTNNKTIANDKEGNMQKNKIDGRTFVLTTMYNPVKLSTEGGITHTIIDTTTDNLRGNYESTTQLYKTLRTEFNIYEGIYSDISMATVLQSESNIFNNTSIPRTVKSNEENATNKSTKSESYKLTKKPGFSTSHKFHPTELHIPMKENNVSSTKISQSVDQSKTTTITSSTDAISTVISYLKPNYNNGINSTGKSIRDKTTTTAFQKAFDTSTENYNSMKLNLNVPVSQLDETVRENIEGNAVGSTIVTNSLTETTVTSLLKYPVEKETPIHLSTVLYDSVNTMNVTIVTTEDSKRYDESNATIYLKSPNRTSAYPFIISDIHKADSHTTEKSKRTHFNDTSTTFKLTDNTTDKTIYDPAVSVNLTAFQDFVISTKKSILTDSNNYKTFTRNTTVIPTKSNGLENSTKVIDSADNNTTERSTQRYISNAADFTSVMNTSLPVDTETVKTLNEVTQIPVSTKLFDPVNSTNGKTIDKNKLNNESNTTVYPKTLITTSAENNTHAHYFNITNSLINASNINSTEKTIHGYDNNTKILLMPVETTTENNSVVKLTGKCILTDSNKYLNFTRKTTVISTKTNGFTSTVISAIDINTTEGSTQRDADFTSAMNIYPTKTTNSSAVDNQTVKTVNKIIQLPVSTTLFDTVTTMKVITVDKKEPNNESNMKKTLMSTSVDTNTTHAHYFNTTNLLIDTSNMNFTEIIIHSDDNNTKTLLKSDINNYNVTLSLNSTELHNPIAKLTEKSIIGDNISTTTFTMATTPILFEANNSIDSTTPVSITDFKTTEEITQNEKGFIPSSSNFYNFSSSTAENVIDLLYTDKISTAGYTREITEATVIRLIYDAKTINPNATYATEGKKINKGTQLPIYTEIHVLSNGTTEKDKRNNKGNSNTSISSLSGNTVHADLPYDSTIFNYPVNATDINVKETSMHTGSNSVSTITTDSITNKTANKTSDFDRSTKLYKPIGETVSGVTVKSSFTDIPNKTEAILTDNRVYNVVHSYSSTKLYNSDNPMNTNTTKGSISLKETTTEYSNQNISNHFNNSTKVHNPINSKDAKMPEESLRVNNNTNSFLQYTTDITSKYAVPNYPHTQFYNKSLGKNVTLKQTEDGTTKSVTVKSNTIYGDKIFNNTQIMGTFSSKYTLSTKINNIKKLQQIENLTSITLQNTTTNQAENKWVHTYDHIEKPPLEQHVFKQLQEDNILKSTTPLVEMFKTGSIISSTYKVRDTVNSSSIQIVNSTVNKTTISEHFKTSFNEQNLNQNITEIIVDTTSIKTNTSSQKFLANNRTVTSIFNVTVDKERKTDDNANATIIFNKNMEITQLTKQTKVTKQIDSESTSAKPSKKYINNTISNKSENIKGSGKSESLGYSHKNNLTVNPFKDAHELDFYNSTVTMDSKIIVNDFSSAKTNSSKTEFVCVTEGRFSDVLNHNYYYICVKINASFIRYKLHCQNGYNFNKSTLKCLINLRHVATTENQLDLNKKNANNKQIYSQSGIAATERIENKPNRNVTSDEIFVNQKSSKSNMKILDTETVIEKPEGQHPNAPSLVTNNFKTYLPPCNTTISIINKEPEEIDSYETDIEIKSSVTSTTNVPSIVKYKEPMSVKPALNEQELFNLEVEIFKDTLIKYDTPLVADKTKQSSTISMTTKEIYINPKNIGNEEERDVETFTSDIKVEITNSPIISSSSKSKNIETKTTVTVKPSMTYKSMSVQDKSITKALDTTTSKVQNEPHFECRNKKSAKYAASDDCKTFYICVGKRNPVVRICPNGTVFSDIRKQCTKDLSHCIRKNKFECTSEGRFRDLIMDVYYYICVKDENRFIRFKLRCQNGYHVNRSSLKCERQDENKGQSAVSRNSSVESNDKSTAEIRKEEERLSERHRNKKRDISFKCEEEGKFSDPENCRKYYVCSKKNDKLKKKRKRCKSDEVFHKDKHRCVCAESFDCD